MIITYTNMIMWPIERITQQMQGMVDNLLWLADHQYRGKKLIVWILGFFQSLIFVVAISSVLTQLDNILNVIGYATGFATGSSRRRCRRVVSGSTGSECSCAVSGTSGMGVTP